MDKNWSLEKKDLRKAANEFFISYAKIFLIVLPILLVLSIFFILVGVLDDPEALDYGIPCGVLFLVLSICLLGLYIVQYFRIYKKCAQSKFFIQQQYEKFLYKINEEEFRMLELYKIYTLKDFYLINDLNSKNIIIILKHLD
ncbi:MAG: hypothetical protein K2M08_01550, partial [Anaeroplasmataceae bacterium]|nr:hypothetical protein [Anaeroplasmataceae bacterium]